MDTPHRVVVGVDGSDHSLKTVAYAAHEAAARHLPLHVVHAYVPPFLPAALLQPAGYASLEANLRPQAEEVLTEAINHAKQTVPDVTVDGELMSGSPGAALVLASQSASLVVVGYHGTGGGVTRVLAGSVSIQVATHAACPVVVVRPDHQWPALAERPVVVGVDDSRSAAAIDFAYETAALRRVPLRAVHAWTAPVSTGPGDMMPLVYDVDEVHDEEARLLAECVAGRAETYPDVSVSHHVVHAAARPALREESTRAGLLVVGSRGRGGFTGLLLGSVSQAMVHHAECPVAVVRSHL